MAKHALLSAPASKQRLNCPPSAKMCVAEVDRVIPYAQPGKDAHELFEVRILTALVRSPNDPTENLEYYDAEMEDCATEYCNYVMEQYEEAKTYCEDPEVMIEEKLDFSRWVLEGFGTGDCIIVVNKLLHIIDFKYGISVLVNERNSQMMSYSLGASSRKLGGFQEG